MTSSTLLWKTSDGRVVKISDMEDRHLLNAVRLLHRRKAEEVPAAGSEIRARFRWMKTWQPFLDAMETECKNRNLDTSNLTSEKVKVLVAKRTLSMMPKGPLPPPDAPPKRLLRKEE